MTRSHATTSAEDVPRAGLLDTVRVALGVVGPTLAQGVIARRPRVVGLAERLDSDRVAVRVLQRLARRYGPGPLRIALPGRSLALVLAPQDVHRVLRESPEPFALANREKRGALGQFQPDGVLVSHGPVRADRRAFNEAVLDTPRPVHRIAAPLVAAVAEEARLVADEAARSGTLSWATASAGWRCAVRRVVLGDGARDDQDLHADLDALRYRANWSFLAPRDRTRRDRLRARIGAHLRRADPGSLAELIAGRPTDEEVDAVDQVPQWLFASDPALMVAYRALALLGADPGETDRVRAELDDEGPTALRERRRLRAAVLESVRLWPTTPMVLRDTTTETTWSTGRLPAGTGVAIYAPFFHRDDELAWADDFRPENWLDDAGHGSWPLIPFSEGPGVCPGQNLVLLMTTTFLGVLLDRLELRLSRPAHLDPRALPGVVSPFHLRFAATPRR